MKMSTAGDSAYLAKEDVPYAITATIARVTHEKVKFRDKLEDKWIMYFSAPALKPMCLNVGNRKQLVKLYGDDTDNYVGKLIGVWVNPNVEFEGEIVGGLRLRAPADAPAPSSGAWENLARAEFEAKPHGISREAIIAAIKAAGGNGWKPERDTPLVQQMIRESQAMARQGGEHGFDDVPPPPADRRPSEIPF